MSFPHLELSCLETIRRLNFDLFDVLCGKPIPFAVLVCEWTRRIVERFEIDVGQVGCVVSANPAGVFVVSHVRQWKAKARITREVPTLIAVKVTFINLAGAEERQMRIDEKHCITRRAL